MNYTRAVIGMVMLCTGGAAASQTIVPTKTGAPDLQQQLKQGLQPGEADKLREAHNAARQAVTEASPAIPDLTWSTALEANAQAYVDKMMKGELRKGKPIDGHDLERTDGSGENLAAPQDFTLPAADVAVTMWVKEKDRNFMYAPLWQNNIPTSEFPGSGHYTQVVWSRSREVGCGAGSRVMDRQNGAVGHARYYIERVIICRYLPAGNFEGQYPYHTAANPAPAGATTVAAAGPTPRAANFKDTILAVNNKVRATPLTWNETLVAAAEEEATKRAKLANPQDKVFPDQQVSLMEKSGFPDPATGFATHMEWNKAWLPAAIAQAKWTRIGCATRDVTLGDTAKVLVVCQYGEKL